MAEFRGPWDPIVVTIEWNPCHDWALGHCPLGEDCSLDHHPNLKPSPNGFGEARFKASIATSEACTNCLRMTRPCDKVGRGGDDDPCSECRWFGGVGCKCVLATDISYNDRFFKQMLSRGRSGYDLAPHRDRLARSPNRWGTWETPVAMPADEVKEDWTGETREQLLAKADMIPHHVREYPRDHLISPGAETLSAMFPEQLPPGQNQDVSQESSWTAITEDDDCEIRYLDLAYSVRDDRSDVYEESDEE